MDFLNLDLSLTAEEPPPGGYNVAVDSPVGKFNGLFSLASVRDQAEALRAAMAGSEVPQPLAEAAGARLFEALFRDEVRDAYRDSLSAARDEEKGLRLRLYTQRPTLVALPWEYLYEARRQRWLALYPHTSVVRALPVATSEAPTVEGDVRLLALLSDPMDAPPLDVEREWAGLQEAADHAALALERVEPTHDALVTALRQRPPQILHFTGHGSFEGGEGALLLRDTAGRGHPLAARHLATLLGGQPALRLVVLNACEGAESGSASAFAGIAQALLQQGVPAVIAMQAPIEDEQALRFSGALYAALADGVPLERALRDARLHLKEANSWGVPALYSQSATLFTLTPLTDAEKAERLFTRAVAADPEAREGLLRKVLALAPEHAGATAARAALAGATEARHRYEEADAAYRTAQWREALRLFEQVERLLPNFGATRSRLAELLGRLGGERGGEARPAAAEWPELLPILNALKEGRLIPFLGWDVSRFGRPSEDAWVRGHSIPAADEMARELAIPLGESAGQATTLLQVAQLTSLSEGESVLYERLSELFREPVAPTMLHRLLAELPGRLAAKGYPTSADRRFVLFSVAFDDLLERAFEEAGQPYHLFAYRRRYRDLDGVEHPGSFLHVSPSGEVAEVPPKEANRYNGHDSDRHPVIVKLVGRCATIDPECLVITEDQYLEYLPAQVIGDLLPATLLTKIKRRSFLFIGYTLADWYLRLVWQRMRVGTSRLHDKGWAVLPTATLMERELWRSQEISPLVARPEAVVAAINEWLDRLEAH